MALPSTTINVSDLWRWDGRIDRLPYVAWGTSLVLLKFGIDTAIATFIFGRAWSFWNYFVPGKSLDILSLSQSDKIFYGTLVLLALPFVWTGVVLTMRRLRAANMPVWLVKLFFIPIVNIVLFLVLSVVPTQEDEELKKITETDSTTQIEGPAAGPKAPVAVFASEKELPADRAKRPVIVREVAHPVAKDGFFAVVTTVPAAALITYFGAAFLQSYGWGLFIGVPFAIGMSSALMFGKNTPKTLKQCLVMSLLATTLLGAAVFIWAWEGMLCLVMAAPIAYSLALMGGLLGYNMQKRRIPATEQKWLMIALIFLMPAMMGAEYRAESKAPMIAVTSEALVHAPPAVVWHNVIAFPELPEPTDPLFKLGIAYPTGATITGSGPGAIRKCQFSTGAFIEPINVWDEPHLLKFGVSAQPPSMQEWSWKREIHPAHLQGYLQVQGGQFKLEPYKFDSGEDGTRLIGTTWYRNNMWPNAYWRLWSDQIIHRIHLRVLNEISRLAAEQHSP